MVAPRGFGISPRGNFGSQPQQNGPRPDETRYYLTADGTIRGYHWRNNVQWRQDNCPEAEVKAFLDGLQNKRSMLIRGDTFHVGVVNDPKQKGVTFYFSTGVRDLLKEGVLRETRVKIGRPWEVAASSTENAASPAPQLVSEDLPA